MEAVVSSTPAPISTPAPAAPATSAPSVESSSGKRPASFAEAFAQDAALHPETSPTPTDTAAIAPVETPPIESAPITPSAPQGPIPFEVHKTALENARAKERDALSAEWKPYEAIRSVPPETMQSWFGVAKRMADDPVGFAMEFIDGLQNDARYAPQLRSHAGRLLAAGRGANADPEPTADVQIVDQAGNPTGLTYSEKQQKAREAWLERQWLAKVDERVAPLKADHDQRVQAEQKAAADHQAIEAQANAFVAEIADIVESPELLPEVQKAMAEHPDWSPRKCALYVRDERVVSPKLKAKADTDALDTLKTKAHAATVNPSSAASTTTKRPVSFHDPNLKW